ncbi:hypothetical protein BGZ95_003166 [Linnemannia exigua]|uniref:CAF1-domain-containing protein n=1 Tax=Linnemannia exigua TaxID=604196 RepID=A0AAD4D4M8_9FUNG|nr:hypothetical protein BGZ95_003166 [Linnemannia exigua]
MEILKEDFEATLPLLHEAISKCDFVAMDTEFTGLNTPANAHRHPDSLSTRYSKVSASANDFLVIQLGICTFTWCNELGAYEARPFNFPCFPSNDDEAKSGERFFMSQSSSLEFLLKNDFDFNKWIRHGIPYLTRREEQDYIIRKTQKEAEKAVTNNHDIPLDDRNRSFVETTIAKIKDWLETTKGLHGDSLTIPANNAFFRRLVHQVIRTEFNGDLDSTSNAQERTMTLRRMTDKIRKEKEDAKIARPPKLNLRRVIDLIVESKKPMIGHNCLLDLMLITRQFLWQLPHELEDWKRAVMLEWNTVIDTKHLASHPLIRPHLDNTGLETVSLTAQREPFNIIGPKVVMAKQFDRYAIKPVKEKEYAQPHTPGTFVTGCVRNDLNGNKSEAAPPATIKSGPVYTLEPFTPSNTTVHSEAPAATATSESPVDAGSKAPVVDAASTPAVATNATPATKPTAAPATEKTEKYHEAGYDAFITGLSYLRLAGYVLKERQRQDGMDSEHSSKKRKIDSSDDVAMVTDSEVTINGENKDTEDEFAKAAREYQQASAAHKSADKASDNDEEVEDGEVEETEVEKKAILEKRKRMIMENPTQEFLEDEELLEYYNKLHVMRSDFPIMNLAGPDPEPEDRPLSYLLRNVHSSMLSSTLFHLFQEYNPFTFSWVDDNSVWIQLSKFAPGPPGEESTREPYEPRPLTLGRLGEDYVDPFCVGSDEKAVKGREMGVVPQAADIEIVAWKQWYVEREAGERQQREVLKQQREQQAAQNQQSRRGPLKRPFRAGPGVSTPTVSTPTTDSAQVFNGAAAAIAAPATPNKPEDVLETVAAAAAGAKRKHDGEGEQGRD